MKTSIQAASQGRELGQYPELGFTCLWTAAVAMGARGRDGDLVRTGERRNS